MMNKSYYTMIQNKKTRLDINSSNLIAHGGQGLLFSTGNNVYKIYHNPLEIISTDKIKKLAILQRNTIIKPECTIFDVNDTPVGFIMKKAYGVPLCKLFVEKFKTDNNITDRDIENIVKIIVDTTKYIHSKRILIVDGNELSYIVKDGCKQVYFIDVDSYQFKNHIDQTYYLKWSIKDFHSKTLSELTDWFSAAVVIFWLYAGVHPFKGKHPDFKLKGPEGLKARMVKNVSVFNKDVKIAESFRNRIKQIPKNYKEWFIKMFEKGQRLPPPGLPLQVQIIATIQKDIIGGTGNFDIVLFKDLRSKNEISYFGRQFNVEVLEMSNKRFVDTYIDGKVRFSRDRYLNPEKSFVTIGSDRLNPFLVNVINSDVVANNINTNNELTIHAYGSFIYENSIYLQQPCFLLELKIIKPFNAEFGTTSFPNKLQILSKSSQSLNGFLYFIGLGQTILVLPIPGHGFISKQVNELNDYTIVDGKYDNGVCQIIGKKNDLYDKIIIRIVRDGTYDIRIVEDVGIDSINFVTLNTGICASFSDVNTLELFHNRPGTQNVKSITDNAIDSSSMKLWKDGSRLLFSQGDKLYVIKTRRK